MASKKEDASSQLDENKASSTMDAMSRVIAAIGVETMRYSCAALRSDLAMRLVPMRMPSNLVPFDFAGI